MQSGQKKNKNEYQKAIWVYEKRRQELRVKYAGNRKEYGKRVATISRKINHWKFAIKRIEKREAILNNWNEKIYQFLGCYVKNSAGKRNNTIVTARNIFFKQGRGNGINGRVLSEYCGMHKITASVNRFKFTRSFKTNKENLDIWKRWQKYLQSESAN